MSLGNVHLTPQLVQAVRDAADILEIASEATQIQRRGKRYLGLCPFHKEKTPSFSVDPQQGLFYCFGCGAGGDAIRLYMEQTGDDFPAAIEALARRYGIPIPRGVGRQQEGPRVGPALEAAAELYARELDKSPAAQRYLERRQIPEELRRGYGLGYAPDSWSFLRAALAERFSLQELETAGLVGRSQKTGEPYDRFRHRLMFPITSPAGTLVGFGGRTLGDDKAKYVNTAETDRFRKGTLLYGLTQAKRALRDGRQALLVEGYFDVLGAAAAGLGWAVAPMGTALTAEQARLLSRYVDEVVVAFDADDAGDKAFERTLPLLLAAGLAVRRARFPSGHDPDSLRLERGDAAVRELIETADDGVWLEISRRLPGSEDRTPAAKTRAATAILELLRSIRDPIVRRDYGQRAAEHLGVPEALFASRLGPQLYAPTGGPDDPVARREVRSLEEKALEQLLRDAGPVPDLDRLPTPEAFFDPQCRNIYAVFCDLYRRGGGAPPATGEVLSRLSGEGGAVDRAARLLLEESDSAGEDLAASLARLERRWQKQRLPELMREIKEAQERGDATRLTELLEEKKSLSRSLHPEMTGNLW